MAKPKRRATSFLVLVKASESDGRRVLLECYDGPDKKRAREVAAKQLQNGKDVIVIRGVVTKLTDSSLKASLPVGVF